MRQRVALPPSLVAPSMPQDYRRQLDHQPAQKPHRHSVVGALSSMDRGLTSTDHSVAQSGICSIVTQPWLCARPALAPGNHKVKDLCHGYPHRTHSPGETSLSR